MPLISKRAAFLCLGIAILGIVTGAGLILWRSHVVETREKRSFAMAQQLLETRRPKDALRVIWAAKASDRYDQAKWLPLEIEALEQARNVHRLLYLYQQYPLDVLEQERASVLVARALLQMRNMDLYNQVREAWRAKEKSPEMWFALDADALVVQGRPEQAKALLSSRSFPGKADCGRLIRLAAMKSGEDMNEAWKLLEQAYRADPRNPDVRLFRGQVLEAMGRTSLARVEYVAALVCDPTNPILRDNLAEFYRRCAAYDLALTTWIDGMPDTALDYFWVKVLFWSKVACPALIPPDRDKTPTGELASLIDAMKRTKPDAFWDNTTFQKDPALSRFAQSRQEVYWLMILQALKEGSEARAMELLRSSRFKRTSFNPDLERALRMILVYRRWGVLMDPDEDAPAPRRGVTHQFFEELDRLAHKGPEDRPASSEIPPDVEKLLKSDEAFSALFVASGWMEAAILLHKLPVIPHDIPTWVAYGLTQALRHNRGNRAALEFALRQKRTADLDLLIGEILLADAKTDRAAPILDGLAREKSPRGLRAAWLLSLASLARGDLDGARRIVTEYPSISGTVTAKEILARISLGQGNAEEAQRIYAAIADESLEAKAYLAKTAFARRDLKAARRYTEELLEYFPDTMELRENLLMIEREERRGPS